MSDDTSKIFEALLNKVIDQSAKLSSEMTSQLNKLATEFAEVKANITHMRTDLDELKAKVGNADLDRRERRISDLESIVGRQDQADVESVKGKWGTITIVVGGLITIIGSVIAAWIGLNKKP